MKRPIIGLTGGIATGKSTVSKFFSELGITIVDADLIARQVVEQGSPALKQISTKFGPSILLSDGQLNRAKLRSIIFSDGIAKSWLNNLLHPLIRKEILKQLANANSPYVILDAPLLFENNLDKLCTKSVVVDIPETLQLERACLRDDVDTKQVTNIIASQMPRQNKLKLASYTIDNSQTLKETLQQVKEIHRVLLGA